MYVIIVVATNMYVRREVYNMCDPSNGGIGSRFQAANARFKLNSGTDTLSGNKLIHSRLLISAANMILLAGPVMAIFDSDVKFGP